MNTWQTLQLGLQRGRQSWLTGHRAMVSWALMVAIALLSFFVHVLNEQVQRGAAMREQFRLGARVSAPAKAGQALRVAEAKGARQAVTAAP